MIKAKSVRKVYSQRGREVNAVDDISIDIKKGDFVSIIGPSGSGKSSLLLILGGMLSPTAGQVWIDGVPIYDLSANDRSALRQKKMGFVFQTFNLIPYLTALQNVQIPLLLAGLPADAQNARSMELLEKIGLADRAEHTPSELSIGQQQRVALARMLANNPEIIFADEPTGNLDPEMGQHVIDFLAQLNAEGKTVVIVTHDLRIAKQAQRTITIGKGGTLCNA